jgi:AsmA protein
MPRPLKWLAIALAVILGLVLIVAAVPNWNGLREPLADVVRDKTGRELTIAGDLKFRPGLSGLRFTASDVTFSNPEWASRDNMVEVGKVTLRVAVLPLFSGRVVFPEVTLDRGEVYLEKSRDGRRNWLLDREQRDEDARATIRRIAVKDGRVDYLDPLLETDVSARVSTRPEAEDAALPLRFSVSGRYKGQPVKASGGGESVMGLRDTGEPYRLEVAGKIGPTSVHAAGAVTTLLKLSAADAHIALSGGSLDELFPLIGIVLPETPAYTTSGRLVHSSGLWRYEGFKGRVGRSDIAGKLYVDVRGARPFLRATLKSRELHLADLGPLVGAGKARERPAPGRVLPDSEFRTDRWSRMDADVTLDAASIKRPEALPIDNLSTRLRMQDAVLRLQPLKFEIAGGSLAGTVKLDGRENPIRADVDLKARKFKIAKLFPTVDLSRASLGEVNGDIKLAGRGNSVAAMLDTADGNLAAVAGSGTVSRLVMEAVGLHILQMLQLRLTGDEVINIRCGIADFGVKDGVMQANVLVVDSDVTRVDGTGHVDLGEETLALTLRPTAKKFRLIALPTPIHVRGKFADPDVGLDKGKLALRSLGAAALGAINPALTLLPLIEAGPGRDSDCARLIADTGVPARKPAK